MHQGRGPRAASHLEALASLWASPCPWPFSSGQGQNRSQAPAPQGTGQPDRGPPRASHHRIPQPPRRACRQQFCASSRARFQARSSAPGQRSKKRLARLPEPSPRTALALPFRYLQAFSFLRRDCLSQVSRRRQARQAGTRLPDATAPQRLGSHQAQ